jgi:hypothetical protein
MDEFAERLAATAAAHEKEVRHDCTGSMLSHDKSDTNHSPCFVSVPLSSPSSVLCSLCPLSSLRALSLSTTESLSLFHSSSLSFNTHSSPRTALSARRSIGRAGGRSARRERGAFARARNRTATVVRRRRAAAAVGSGIVLSLRHRRRHRHTVKIIFQSCTSTHGRLVFCCSFSRNERGVPFSSLLSDQRYVDHAVLYGVRIQVSPNLALAPIFYVTVICPTLLISLSYTLRRAVWPPCMMSARERNARSQRPRTHSSWKR